MRVRRVSTTTFTILLAGSLLLGGCNVFNFVDSTPKTVDGLLADARSALTAGNPSRAIQLLERALEKDSTDVRVRVELGNALYTDRGLDIFALRAAGEHLVDSTGSAFPSSLDQSRSTSRETVCTGGMQPSQSSDRYTTIPLDADPLRFLSERRDVVRRVDDLLVEGVLRRRLGAFTDASLRVRRTGLLVGAVTVAVEELINVREVFGETGGALFLDRRPQQGHVLLACAETDKTLRQSHQALCTLATATRRAIQWLRNRNQISENEQENVLIEPLQAVSDAASAQVECP